MKRLLLLFISLLIYSLIFCQQIDYQNINKNRTKKGCTTLCIAGSYVLFTGGYLTCKGYKDLNSKNERLNSNSDSEIRAGLSIMKLGGFLIIGSLIINNLENIKIRNLPENLKFNMHYNLKMKGLYLTYKF